MRPTAAELAGRTTLRRGHRVSRVGTSAVLKVVGFRLLPNSTWVRVKSLDGTVGFLVDATDLQPAGGAP